MTRRSSLLPITLAVAWMLALLPGPAVAGSKKEVVTVKASLDEAYKAALEAVADTGHRVRSSDREAGNISAEYENAAGEKTAAINVIVAQRGAGEVEVTITVTKRWGSLFGGSVEKRLGDFKKAFLQRLKVAQTAAPKAAPATQVAKKVALGQSREEVEAAFGTPEKIIDLGDKVTYAYKDMKVIFVNGKVVDVQ